MEQGDGTVKSGSQAIEEGQEKKDELIDRGTVSRFAPFEVAYIYAIFFARMRHVARGKMSQKL